MDRITIPSVETAKDNCEKLEPAFLCVNTAEISKPLLIKICHGNIAPFGAHEPGDHLSSGAGYCCRLPWILREQAVLKCRVNRTIRAAAC